MVFMLRMQLGMDSANDYYEIGYGVDAGPGSFSISYGDYENKGSNYLNWL